MLRLSDAAEVGMVLAWFHFLLYYQWWKQTIITRDITTHADMIS